MPTASKPSSRPQSTMWRASARQSRVGAAEAWDVASVMRGSVAQPASAGAPTSVRLADPAATARAGAAMAAALEGGMVVTLSGDLGAGKSTLVRGVLRARGIEGAIKSPTYA